MPGVYILLFIVLAAIVWAVVTYNTLVRLRQHCREAWASIDTELQRRYDLIPNLVSTVKGYAAHEQETLEAVVEARNRAVASTGSPGSQAADENELVGTLKRLLVVVERYPDLKASDNFLALQRELANTEDRIQAARRFYNANVRDINTRIEVVPSNLIARVFSFEQHEFFQIDAACVGAVPQVGLSQQE